MTPPTLTRPHTEAESLLLAAYRLATSPHRPAPALSAELLTEAAYYWWPDRFGFTGTRGRYPDLHKVRALLGHRGGPIRRRGWLERVGRGRYAVTRTGALRAVELERGNGDRE